MIRMTRQTDYGIVLLTLLAADPERLHNAPDLAAEAQLPPPTVSKILKILTREGLLASHRGVKGGYTLARLPEQVSLLEIVTALEGPVAMTECIDDSPGECTQEPICPVRGHWQVINHAVRKALSQVTLAEMVRPSLGRLVTIGAPGPRTVELA